MFVIDIIAAVVMLSSIAFYTVKAVIGGGKKQTIALIPAIMPQGTLLTTFLTFPVSVIYLLLLLKNYARNDTPSCIPGVKCIVKQELGCVNIKFVY